MERLISLIGLGAMIGVAWLLSSNRKLINWKLVGIGTGLQLLFAIIVLKTSPGRAFFEFMNDVVVKLLDFTAEGAKFVFGGLVSDPQNFGFIFAFQVLPTIIFFSSFMTVLYYLGIMQAIVKFFAMLMAKTMKTSGAESLSASANIFVGQTEAPLVIKPFVAKMTMSELMAVMTGGMATIAGGVMAAYVGMLRGYFPDIAGHLLAASIMSAPAALVMAKIMVPEDGIPETMGNTEVKIEKIDANVIDAAARGASEGLMLALNVGAMLMAFISLVALLNHVLLVAGDGVNKLIGKNPCVLTVTQSLPSGELQQLIGSTITVNLTKKPYGSSQEKVFQSIVEKVEPGRLIMKDRLYAPAQQNLAFAVSKNDVVVKTGTAGFGGAIKMTMEIILGVLLSPLAFLLGAPWKEALTVGSLIGEKTILNEFVAYMHFGDLLKSGAELSEKSKVILTYCLCGFSNLGSIAIQLGGIGGLAPNRRGDLARLGMKSMIAGSFACFMTAAIAAFLL
ncbi:MAG: nucleoside transporter C-terminal domain-containing protein [Candidatus Wallbacteria bacterium]|nr:nucleoside transporter C-terminal domain-containing protein [Candidatus Wallbacteria bacterium]